MRIFISWSGTKGRRLAEALHEWMPKVIQALDPYISSRDIEKGARWAANLAIELDKANFGIVCLTSDNISAPWILFESGALSKSLEHGKVVPILFGCSDADLRESPLLQFQNVKFEASDMQGLLKSINDMLAERAIKETILLDSFTKNWPELERAVTRELSQHEKEKKRGDPHTAAMEELSSLCREQLRKLNLLEERIHALQPADVTTARVLGHAKLIDAVADFAGMLKNKIAETTRDVGKDETIHKEELLIELTLIEKTLNNVDEALGRVTTSGGTKDAVDKAILALRTSIGTLRFF